MNIGDKIRSLRKKQSLTLKDVHLKTGLSVSFISDIENKRRNPSIENLKLLADTFGVTTNDLISDEALPNKSSINDSYLKNSIGNKIKDWRKLSKLTQVELAKKANISRSYLADIEKNRYNASVDTLKAIANGLNVTLSDILYETPSNPLLNDKDKSAINRDLQNIMDDFRNGTDGFAYYNGQELDEDDLDLIEAAMKIALEQIKIKNKEKYTPKKYKK